MYPKTIHMKNIFSNHWTGRLALMAGALVLLLGMVQASFAQQVINPNNVNEDTKGTVTLPTKGDLALLGNTWTVTECCGWSGTWTRRPNTNIFDAKWKHTNGSIASDVVELSSWTKSSNVVTIWRATMNGQYKATYNPTNKTLVNGTATWYPAGQTWSATIR